MPAPQTYATFTHGTLRFCISTTPSAYTNAATRPVTITGDTVGRDYILNKPTNMKKSNKQGGDSLVIAGRPWLPHFPSYIRFVNRGGDTKSEIGTRRTCGIKCPVLSITICILMIPHFGFCLGMSNVHLKLLTVKRTEPDSTTMFVSKGIASINAFTASNCLTKILFRSDSDDRKSNGSSWNAILHSRLVSLPIFHPAASDCEALSRNRTFEPIKLVPLMNDMDRFHPNPSSGAIVNNGFLGSWLMIRRTIAEAFAIGLFRESLCHSSLATNPATTTSTTMPLITNHSPHFLVDSQQWKSVMFLYFSFSASTSIKSPTNTIIPPIQAEKTNQKLDPVIVSIYVLTGIVVVGTLICFVVFIIGRQKGIY